MVRALLRPVSLCSRFLSVAMLCALGAGCTRSPDPGVTVLQFYLWGGGPVADLEQRAIARFESENPGIRVELTPVSGAYNEKMQTLIVGGVMPDIMTVDVNAYYEWADRGLLMDVTDLMAAAQREQHLTFMPIVPQDLLYNGRYYVVPYGVSGVIPQVNLELLARGHVTIPPPAGVTWAWVEQWAPRLSRLSGHPEAPAEFFGAMPDMTSMLFTFGGRVFDDSRHPAKVLVNSPEAEEMCRYVRRVVGARGLLSRAETTKASDEGTPYGMFSTGQAVMYIMGIWGHPGSQEPATFAWDVIPFPAGPRGDRVTAAGAQLLAISARTKHAEAARRFLRFYLSRENIMLHVRTGNYMPVYREMMDDPAVRAAPGYPRSVQYFFDTLEAGRSRLPVNGPGLGELRRIIDSRLGQLTAEPDVPIPVILQTLEDEIYRWLAREKQKGFYR